MIQIASTEARVLNASMRVRTQGLDPSVQLVRKEFYVKTVAPIAEKPFWQSYKVYLSLLTCKASTKMKLEISRKVFEYFCKNISYKADITTFDKIVFGRFIRYLLLNQKMADSTINRHVRALKAFLRFTYPERDFSFVRYSMLPIDEEVIALSEEELKILIDADLNGHLNKTRDLFVFLATTGMRHSDSQLFDKSWITEEQILEFSQLKTGGRALTPLYEVSKKILLKYGGTPPKIRNQKFNVFLKELFKELKFDRRVVIQTVRGK